MRDVKHHKYSMYHEDIFWFQMCKCWQDLFYILGKDNCDFFDFLPKFFHSKYMEHCDNRNPYYTSMFYVAILEQLELECIHYKTDEHNIIFAGVARWIAEFYASATHYLILDGSIAYDCLPLEKLVRVYPGLCDTPIYYIFDEIITGERDLGYKDKVTQLAIQKREERESNDNKTIW